MLLARTDPDAPKHKGITYFAFEMDQPGVEVRPLREMTGRSLFCEVFFTDARVAESAMHQRPRRRLERREHHAGERARRPRRRRQRRGRAADSRARRPACSSGRVGDLIERRRWPRPRERAVAERESDAAHEKLAKELGRNEDPVHPPAAGAGSTSSNEVGRFMSMRAKQLRRRRAARPGRRQPGQAAHEPDAAPVRDLGLRDPRAERDDHGHRHARRRERRRKPRCSRRRRRSTAAATRSRRTSSASACSGCPRSRTPTASRRCRSAS